MNALSFAQLDTSTSAKMVLAVWALLEIIISVRHQGSALSARHEHTSPVVLVGSVLGGLASAVY